MAIGKKSRAGMEKSRANVYRRDNEQCVVRGSIWQQLKPCGGHITLQHRVTRGMGSSAKWDSEPYLLTMCAVHNALEPASAEFRKFCERRGYSIPRWVAEQTPINRIPVAYVNGWFLLDGTERFGISEPTALDLMAEIYGDENV
jgi:hypothetical protein